MPFALPGQAIVGRRGRRVVVGTSAAIGGPIPVLFVIGDSNPRGAAADEGSLSYTPSSNVMTWSGTAFVTYTPGTRTTCTVPNTAAGAEAHPGMEIGFIQSYLAANPSGQLAIVKYAKAGSYQGYSAGSPVNGDATNSWDTTNGSLTSGALTQLASAMTALRTSGYTPSLVGVIEATGTNDAADATLSAAVNAKKTAMYAAIRAASDFVAGTTAFLTIRQHSASPQANITTVRTAQAAVANLAADALLVDTDGLATNAGDATHFTIASLQTIGASCYSVRYARMSVQTLALSTKMRALWDFAAPGTTVVGSGVIGSIADQIGNRVLSQGTPANQPATATLNGKASASFDGTNDALTLTAASGLGTADLEGFAILNNRTLGSDASGRVFYARGGGTSPTDFRLGRTSISSVSRFYFQVGNGAGAGTQYRPVDTYVDAAAAGPHVVMWRMVSRNLYVSVDGNPEVLLAMPADALVSDTSMFIGSASGSFWGDGTVRLIGETATLTSGERTALRTALLAEAGL